jgi:hypothetical protein
MAGHLSDFKGMSIALNPERLGLSCSRLGQSNFSEEGY